MTKTPQMNQGADLSHFQKERCRSGVKNQISVASSITGNMAEFSLHKKAARAAKRHPR